MLTHSHIQTQAHAKLAQLKAHNRDAPVYDEKLFFLFLFYYATQHFLVAAAFFFGSSAADDDKEHHTHGRLFFDNGGKHCFSEVCSASHCADFYTILR